MNRPDDATDAAHAAGLVEWERIFDAIAEAGAVGMTTDDIVFLILGAVAERLR